MTTNKTVLYNLMQTRNKGKILIRGNQWSGTVQKKAHTGLTRQSQ